MKTKIDMAHDYAMALVLSPDFDDDMSLSAFVKHVWKYADKMQAEEDKRKVGGVPDAIASVGVSDAIEWKLDWSQAPERATAWKIGDHGVPMWLQSHNNINQSCVWLSDAPSFGYQGDWRESLRKRP